MAAQGVAVPRAPGPRAGPIGSTSKATRTDLLSMLVPDYDPNARAEALAAAATGGESKAATQTERSPPAPSPRQPGAVRLTPATRPANGSGRQLKRMIELQVTGLALRSESYSTREAQEAAGVGPSGSPGEPRWCFGSVLVVAVDDLRVVDCIEASALHRLLGYWDDEVRHPRVSGTPFLRFRWDVVVPMRAAANGQGQKGRQEIRFNVRVLPIRCNVGQDAIEFGQDVAAVAVAHLARTELVAAADAVPEPARQSQSMFFQLADVRSLHVFASVCVCARALGERCLTWLLQHMQIGEVKFKLDYNPTHVNGKALLKGKMDELLHLIPIEGLQITLHPCRSASVQG